MKIANKVYMILCEDIREEKGGKLSLLGVYGIDKSGIIPDEIPSNLHKLCLAVMLSEIQIELTKCHVTITAPGKEKMEINLPTTPTHEIGKNVTLGIAVSPFQISKAGEAKFELRFNNEKKPSLVFNFQIIAKAQPARLK